MMRGVGLRKASDYEAEIERLEAEIDRQARTGGLVAVSNIKNLIALVSYSKSMILGGDEDNAPAAASFAVIESRKSDRRCHHRSLSSYHMAISVPDKFRCSISLELMADPVIVATGHTYDRSSISRWINSDHRTCPQERDEASALGPHPQPHPQELDPPVVPRQPRAVRRRTSAAATAAIPVASCRSRSRGGHQDVGGLPGRQAGDGVAGRPAAGGVRAATAGQVRHGEPPDHRGGGGNPVPGGTAGRPRRQDSRKRRHGAAQPLHLRQQQDPDHGGRGGGRHRGGATSGAEHGGEGERGGGDLQLVNDGGVEGGDRRASMGDSGAGGAAPGGDGGGEEGCGDGNLQPCCVQC